MEEDIVNARKEKETHSKEMSWMKQEVQCIYSESACFPAGVMSAYIQYTFTSKPEI